MSYVYIAFNEESGITKIGRGVKPTDRVKTFTGFKLIATYNAGSSDVARLLENQMLKILKPFLTKGKEWFTLPKETNLTKTFSHLIVKASEVIVNNKDLIFKIKLVDHSINIVRK